MSTVTRIDDYIDRIEIHTENGDTHLIPISVFRAVASGRLTVNRISDFIPIYQEITRQWLEQFGLR